MEPDQFMQGWSVRDSLDLYNLPLWSSGFFDANEKGNVVATPARKGGPSIDLKELVDDVRERGHELPLLIRFNDILRTRVNELGDCFATAIRTEEYNGNYRGVYPIKVNQQAHIVEELLKCGGKHNLGLEVGSRPELLAGLALVQDDESLIVCNGYKDEAYLETAMLAQKLGRQVVVIIDRFAELSSVIAVAQREGVRPTIGIRAKLQTRGSGRWAESGGSLSKFGLSTRELVRAVELLKQHAMLDCLQLLHFHMGSQVPSIRVFKEALREASRIYVELARLGANMQFLDVGGGLAVDYDGSNSNFHSSMNYSIQEYANDVVAAIGEACNKAEVAHPTIISESGRALVAHHAVLVFDVLDRHENTIPAEPVEPDENAPEIVRNLFETYRSIQRRQLLEPYHDAIALRDEAHQLFNLGFLDLEARAQSERLFFACCGKLQRLLRRESHVPEELEGLDRALADVYFCNFSVFQSMPDSWAVGQLFPILPIHRLNERPSRRAVLVDLTCDSDGKIDKFVDRRDVKDTLELHAQNGEPYYLAAFLVGAYQEILGDLHNLFGDTNAVHVNVDESGYQINHVVVGDTVAEVLGYVEFDRRDLVAKVRSACERAVQSGRMTPLETRALLSRYEAGLDGYTYLDSAGGTTASRDDREEPTESPRASEETRRSDSSAPDAYPETPPTRTESGARPDAS